MDFTKYEMQLIDWLDSGEFEYGGNYIYYDEWDMKIFRGVISSLIKKDIISIDWANSSAYDFDISNPGVDYIWITLTDLGFQYFPEE